MLGDGLWGSEEIVKEILNCAFQCDYYYIIIMYTKKWYGVYSFAPQFACLAS